MHLVSIGHFYWIENLHRENKWFIQWENPWKYYCYCKILGVTCKSCFKMKTIDKFSLDQACFDFELTGSEPVFRVGFVSHEKRP